VETLCGKVEGVDVYEKTTSSEQQEQHMIVPVAKP